MLYRVTAQCIIGIQRISRVIYAVDDTAALRAVASVLQDHGYYVIDITPV
jgi:hypothetical protein